MLALGMWLAVLGFAQPLEVTIIHTNDLHAKIEPTTRGNSSLGGYARKATVIQRLRESSPNPIVLNAGDTFQGTLYFNVYEGLADLAIMNYIGYHAMAVGNHEFDKGPAPLERFARLAKFPVIAANLDLTDEPSLRDLIPPHTTIEIGGQRVGVIGLVTNDTPNISAPGDTVRFLPYVESVERSVRALRAEGVDKFILLTHIGYEADLELARELRDIGVIVGGHSHTVLGPRVDGLAPPRGPYPTVVRNAAGDTTLVVQAGDWGRLVGHLRVQFDADGRVAGWSGSPVAVDQDVPPDPVVESMVQAFAAPIAAKAAEVIGSTETGLNRDREGSGEHTMGNVIADAMLAATRRAGAVIALMNAGGVRANIAPGNITYGDAITVQPFNNTLVVLELTGAELKAALEHGLARAPEYSGAFLHISAGSRIVFDVSRPAGNRIVELVIDGEPWAAERTYKVCTNNFTASGGDFHEVLKNAPGTRLDTGLLDVDALIEYIQANSPLNRQIEGRIRLVRG